MQYLFDRLSERSTWQGLVAIATVCGVALSPDQVEAIVGAGVAIGAAVSIFTKG